MSIAFATEADELEYIIAELDTLYEIGEECVHPLTGEKITDPEYDELRQKLKSLNPDSKIFAAPTASKASVVNKVVHHPPMVSLEKASGTAREEQYESWLNSITVRLGYESTDGKIVQSYKHDGVAVGLYYENGILKRAGLRPRDGVNGEDVFENIKFVTNVPLVLPVAISCSVRGELECYKETFERVNKVLADRGDAKANPRNYTAGSIRQFKDPKLTAERELTFAAYSMEDVVYPKDYKGIRPTTRRQQAIWASKELKLPFVRMEFHERDSLDDMEALAPELPYEVDGVVLAVDNLEDCEQMGRHGDKESGNPRGAIAWKFKDEVGESDVKEIIWSPGRTGKMTPVAQFDPPIRLAGTNVSQCTLHNIAFLARTGIRRDAKLGVIKSGKIIPKVEYVALAGKQRLYAKDCSPKASREEVESVDRPEQCPSCAHPLYLEEGQPGMWELACRNIACPAQAINSFVFFLATLGIKGVGEAMIERLYQGGKIKNLPDLFSLRGPDFESVGFSRRQSVLAVASLHGIEEPSKLETDLLVGKIKEVIDEKKKVPDWQVMASLGIPGVGKASCKELLDALGSIQGVLGATPQQLAEVPNIGIKTGEVIADYAKENLPIINSLLEKIEPVGKTQGKLTGKSFCFSGGFSEGKQFWEKQVEGHGGSCKGSVGRKVDYLVAGEGSGAKTQAAIKLQSEGSTIQIIDVEQLKVILK